MKFWEWRYNFVGPAWFRRFRTAWQWYWSDEPMISMDEVKHMLGTKQDKASAGAQHDQ